MLFFEMKRFKKTNTPQLFFHGPKCKNATSNFFTCLLFSQEKLFLFQHARADEISPDKIEHENVFDEEQKVAQCFSSKPFDTQMKEKEQ